MRLLRHLCALAKEFWGFAMDNKAWWLIPILIVLALFALLVVTAQGSLPYIYTL